MSTLMTSSDRFGLRTCFLAAGLVACGVAAGGAETPKPPAVPAALMGFKTSEGVVCNTAQTLRLAIEDLLATFGGRYPRGKEFLERLEKMGGTNAPPADVAALSSEALLANPLLDFDKLLLIRRNPANLALPQNWQGNCALPRGDIGNEIDTLSPVRPDGTLTTFHKPAGGRFVGDMDLHFDADRLLFSMPDEKGRFQIWEIKDDGTGLRQITKSGPDVDNYDACYLHSRKIVYDSTAIMQGVPCVGGGNTVANLFLTDADGSMRRRLCFDQDHDWCPTVLSDGRVMYARWEYSDTPHYFTRLLFKMNPDGTGQSELSGSNSCWPNSTFFARPVPGSSSKVVAIISGHHGVPRMGELILFDTTLGQRENQGVVQRIPGRGKPVQARIGDGIADGANPKFLHPFPLSEKYFLVSANIQNQWGIYLVDAFDNIVPIHTVNGAALLEPVPLRRVACPPVIPDRIDMTRKDADVYITDVYAGEGMRGVPRGTVKSLRVYSFGFAAPGMGGHNEIGLDGPWDARRILGTVPVREDGSAAFVVPANTPVAVQPLDAEGKAVQLMRSWFTAMPGERVSCVGCHERQPNSPTAKQGSAFTQPPTPIRPWYGPARGFSFAHEVQPVLDKYCIRCHDGAAKIPDFRASSGGFSTAYQNLHRFVYRPGPESDYHILNPMEYHADNSELVQMLQQGHHNVRLDAQSWDRLITWIDFNVPYFGSWLEKVGPRPVLKRRQELDVLCAGLETDFETIPTLDVKLPDAPPSAPALAAAPSTQAVTCPGWPFQATAVSNQTVDLGNDVKLKMSLIPAGEFVTGNARAKVEQPFWMAAFEVSNKLYAQFDPQHDSRYFNPMGKDQGSRGVPMNGEQEPVVRVSWQRATEFCAWLSAKTGRRFTLPTEAQWEWACRAGHAEPFWFGPLGTDYGKYANLADANLGRHSGGQAPPEWRPADKNVNDGALATTNVQRYEPNPWGLYNMHGNAAEWTRTPADTAGKRIVKGGSFYDRAIRATASFRLAYPEWAGVHTVGFRVICDAQPGAAAGAAAKP
ncbi:MAG: SUMF1/EgtB/PvdO family nonheme iron enzyme [bacterium]